MKVKWELVQTIKIQRQKKANRHLTWCRLGKVGAAPERQEAERKEGYMAYRASAGLAGSNFPTLQAQNHQLPVQNGGRHLLSHILGQKEVKAAPHEHCLGDHPGEKGQESPLLFRENNKDLDIALD